MAKLDYEVMSHAFAAHQQLGCLCDESVYHHSIEGRLREAGFGVESELPVTLTFRNFIKPLYLDLVVNRCAIYELKTVSALTQWFHLVNDETAFHITTFQDDLGAHHPLQLRKLMVPSPLKALLWINIARHQLTLSTIAR